jgi:hypothetical protein
MRWLRLDVDEAIVRATRTGRGCARPSSRVACNAARCGLWVRGCRGVRVFGVRVIYELSSHLLPNHELRRSK